MDDVFTRIAGRYDRLCDVFSLDWAEVIFVMERHHRNKLLKQFRSSIKNQKIIVLGITDDYEFMEPRLVRLFEALVPRHLVT